jgi:hydroxymethylbilane synthase
MSAIDDRAAGAALRAERAVVERLGGGCQMPIGAYAEITGAVIRVTGIVISLDGARVVTAEIAGDAGDPAAAGIEAANRLLDDGAGAILAEARRTESAVEGLQP